MVRITLMHLLRFNCLTSTHAFLKVEKGLKEKTFFGTFGVPIPTKLEEGQLWSLT